MTTFAVICMVARGPLTSMMQASLVRRVAFSSFAHNPQWFESYPANVSITWAALVALEDSCVVDLVECLRKPKHRPHVPSSVEIALEKLIGHRDLVSHPFMGENDWTNPRMKEFEAEGRRYEARVPLVWERQRSLNAELSTEGSPPLPDFYVTIEMAQLLRQIFVASMTPANIARIPNESTLVRFLQESRRRTLQQCQDIANGASSPPRAETPLERIWSALSRGEDPDTTG